MKTGQWIRVTLLAVTMALFVLILGTTAMASGQVLQITAPTNVYAHLYRPFPTQVGSEFAVQVSMKAGPDSGSSWAPSVFVYWNPATFAGVGHQAGDGKFRGNAVGFALGGAFDVGIAALDWVDARIVFTATSVSLSARAKDGEWVIVSEKPRPEFPATLPAEIILGKGFGNNTPTYPNPHLDNSYSTPGSLGVTFMDNLIVTVDGKTVFHETFDSLDAWLQHLDPEIEPAFALVSEEVGNEAFAE